MATNQEGRQGVIRTATGNASLNQPVNADWHDLFDNTVGVIATGTFNERRLSYINVKLSASHTNLNDAMQAFADNESRDDWDSMETFTA